MENPIESAKKWLFGVALRKGTMAASKAVAGLVVGFVEGQHLESHLNAITAVVMPWLAQVGITTTAPIVWQINTVVCQAGIMAGVVFGIEWAHDWAKLKYPDIVKY